MSHCLPSKGTVLRLFNIVVQWKFKGQLFTCTFSACRPQDISEHYLHCANFSVSDRRQSATSGDYRRLSATVDDNRRLSECTRAEEVQKKCTSRLPYTRTTLVGTYFHSSLCVIADHIICMCIHATFCLNFQGMTVSTEVFGTGHVCHAAYTHTYTCTCMCSQLWLRFCKHR